MRNLLRRLRAAITPLLALLLASPHPGVAQIGTDVLAQQSLRPYWYVFIAYALVWILLMGWVVSIGRRIGHLEDPGGGEGGA